MRVPLRSAVSTAYQRRRYVYVIGGWADDGILSNAFQYHTGLDAWTDKKSMKERREGAAGLLYQKSKILVCGGRDFTSVGKYKFKVHSSCELYDILNDRWRSFPALKRPRVFHAMAELSGVVFVFGGTDGKKQKIDSIEKLVTVDGKLQWRLRRETLPEKRSEMAAVVY